MRIIIIGANAAGMSAAAKAKRLVKENDIIVYEQTEAVSLGSCGLPYYIAGYFDDTERLIARSPEQIMAGGIDLRLGRRVVAVDSDKKEIRVTGDDGACFIDAYDKLMIATGASPFVPSLAGSDLSNIFTLRDLIDSKAIRAALKNTNGNAVIVGGGFIGLEMTEALRRQGKKVSLVEMENRVSAAAFDPEITALIENELARNQVELRVGEKLSRFIGKSAIEAVETDKGLYPADMALLALGVRPDTAFLKDSGIARADNGAILVDNQGQTSVKDIYAAGDCASVTHMLRNKHVYYPLATTANKLGRVIGENLAGKKSVWPGTLGAACLKVFDLEAGRCGYSSREIAEDRIDVKSVVVKDKNQTSYYPGQEDILLKVTYQANTGAIIAAQAAGKKGAVLRINALATAIQGRLTVSDLAMSDFCYAPPFSRSWDIMNVAGNIAKPER